MTTELPERAAEPSRAAHDTGDALIWLTEANRRPVLVDANESMGPLLVFR